MLPEWYLRFAESSGPSFVAAWSNADVAAAALVAGGILVTWPAMVALTIAAVLVAVVIGFVHKWLAPARQARIDREAEATASKALADFERDLGKP
jgi:membrane protein implicated in regulation of membrane protease activity